MLRSCFAAVLLQSFSILFIGSRCLAGQGVYVKIVNASSGKVLTAGSAPLPSNAAITERVWDAGLEQQWSLTSVDGTDGTAIEFTNRLTGRLLSVERECAGQGPCRLQQQAAQSNELDQQWEISEVHGGFSKLVSRWSNKVMEGGDDGSPEVRAVKWDGTAREQWSIVPVVVGDGDGVDSVDDEHPAIYPYTTQSTCPSIVGEWRQDGLESVTVWELSQTGNSISGVASVRSLRTHKILEWNVTGVLMDDGTFSLEARRKTGHGDVRSGMATEAMHLTVELAYPDCDRGSNRMNGQAMAEWTRMGNQPGNSDR